MVILNGGFMPANSAYTLVTIDRNAVAMGRRTGHDRRNALTGASKFRNCRWEMRIFRGLRR